MSKRNTTDKAAPSAIVECPRELTGDARQAPAVSIVNHADIMLRIATQFGFTPASRLRLPSLKESPSSCWDDGIPTLDALGPGLNP